MYISPYKNSIASKINVPVINEVETITHPDSIGLNTSYCEKSDKIAKNGTIEAKPSISKKAITNIIAKSNIPLFCS